MQASNEQMEKMTTSFAQTATDMNSMMKDSVSATMQSLTLMTKGCGDLYNCLSDLMQKSIDQSVKASQSMMTASSVNDLVSTQNSVIKTNYESLMKDLTNLSQMSSQIAQQVAAPVTKQMNDSISKISSMTSKSRAA